MTTDSDDWFTLADEAAVWDANKGWKGLEDDEILKAELALDEAADRE